MLNQVHVPDTLHICPNCQGLASGACEVCRFLAQWRAPREERRRGRNWPMAAVGWFAIFGNALIWGYLFSLWVRQ